MNFLSLKIEGLFNRFDYDIPLNKKEHITILTGPNGFGKTMILNILEAIFNRNVQFFENLKFDRILLQSTLGELEIIPREQLRLHLNFLWRETNEVFDLGMYFPSIDIGSIHYLKDVQLFQKVKNEWYVNHTSEVLSFSDILERYPLESVVNSSDRKSYLDDIIKYRLQLFLADTSVVFIKEQRLLIEKIEDINKYIRVPYERMSDYHAKPSLVFHKTINICSDQLQEIFVYFNQQYFTVTQELDSSFPKRLMTEKEVLTEKDFKQRFETLLEKQKKLKEFGLIDAKQETPVFDAENARVLSVYLRDTESKIAVFDEILPHLELFTDILNKRRLSFKKIVIGRSFGFRFITENDERLDPANLSSGEQHEVVLLYNLIFKTDEKTLVLIDEPEISLHVAWQKEFLNDLMKIIALQKMQVVIATHSPQIIGEYWDELVYNLEMLEPA